MYPSELQLNKTNSSETEVPFLDLHLSISDEFIAKFMIKAKVLIAAERLSRSKSRTGRLTGLNVYFAMRRQKLR